MNFPIARGFFQPDFVDHYAILGAPIAADVKEIRKRYLAIARRLHPDSCSAEQDAQKQLANQLLSKWVNPAWEMLSQDKFRTEYLLLLKLKGQAAARKPEQLEIQNDLAQQLFKTAQFEHFYQTSLQTLSQCQYDSLPQVLDTIAQISELNLVYLIRQQGGEHSPPVVPPQPLQSAMSTSTSTSISTSGPTAKPDASDAPIAAAAQPNNPVPTIVFSESSPKLSQEEVIQQFYRRASNFVLKGNYGQATVELRDALKINPNHGQCHSLMGMIYLKQNQATMAKIHFNKALSINPQDPMALEGKQKLEQLTSPSQPPTQKPLGQKLAGGGFLDGLFGKK